MNDFTDEPFRFGVVATPRGAQPWRDTATRVAGLGFDTLLMPDGLQLPSPTAALAVAATVADLRVGTFVFAAPMRPPALVAWEGHSLSVLTGGRFDFGIGTGRAGVEAFTARLGLPYGSGPERLAQVEQAIDALADLDGPDRHTPVLVAAGGPRARELAARRADIVTFALDARTTRADAGAAARDLRARAGERAAGITIATNLLAVGADLPADAERYTGVDAATLVATDSLMLLRGRSSRAMADELQRRRAALGVSYFAVGEAYAEALAPVIELLT